MEDKLNKHLFGIYSKKQMVVLVYVGKMVLGYTFINVFLFG